MKYYIRKYCVEILHQKIMRWSRGLRHPCILCIGVSKKFYAKACLLFNCCLDIKRIIKALFSSIPWFLNFSDLPNYDSNLTKRCTLRLLSKSLVRSTHLPIGVRFLQRFDTLFDSLRWGSFNLALYLCSS